MADVGPNGRINVDWEGDAMSEEEQKQREEFIKEMEELRESAKPVVSPRKEADFERRNEFEPSPYRPKDGNTSRSKIYGVLPSHFSWKGVLGHGAFAEVKHGRIRKGVQDTNALVKTFNIVDYAVKIIPRRTIEVNRQREERISAIFAEKHSHIVCDHPFILKCYDSGADKKHIYFYLELATSKDLCEFTMERKGLSVPLAQYYLAATVACVEYLHGKGYVHRDLKPENFMLTEEMRPKLGDFGCIRILGEHVQYPGAWFTGTPQYMSPEAIQNSKNVTNYPAVDIWSLGPLLYFLLTSKHAFSGKSEYLIFQKVSELEIAPFPEGFDDNAQDLILKCCTKDPEARPTIAKIKDHPFFENIDWDTLAEFDPQTLL